MKKIFIFLVSIIFITCFTSCKKNINIKEELIQYVDSLEKAELIQNDMEYVANFIDNIDPNIDLNDAKGQIDQILLTKELEKQVVEDLINNGYEDRVNAKNCECYGIYNKAVVIGILLPGDCITNFDVDGVNFYYPSDYQMLVWYNHVLYDFSN